MSDEQVQPAPLRAAIMIVEDPVTHDIEITCATQEPFDVRHPAHAIARYIGVHLGEIIRATKEARERGELDIDAPNQPGGGHVEQRQFDVPQDANLVVDPLLGKPDQG